MKPIYIEYLMIILTIVNVFYFTKKYTNKKWYAKVGITILLFVLSVILDAIIGCADMFLPMGQYFHYTVTIMSYTIVNAMYYVLSYNKHYNNFEKAFLEMNNGNEDGLAEQTKENAAIKKKVLLIAVVISVICFALPFVLVIINSSKKGIELKANNKISELPTNMIYKGKVIQFEGIDFYEHQDSEGYTYVAVITADLKNLTDAEINAFSNRDDWDNGYDFQNESGEHVFNPSGNFVTNYKYYTTFMTPPLKNALNSIKTYYSFTLNESDDETIARYMIEKKYQRSEYIKGDPPGYVMDAMTEAMIKMKQLMDQ